MPKAFSEREKEVIRRQIIEKGRSLFETHGIRKTSVDDITRAVGISKGAFYLFFESKEELYLQILEQMEVEVRGSILEYLISPQDNARQNVSAILKRILLTRDTFTLLKNLGKSDIDYLVRKLPAERIQAHANQDEEFIKNFIDKFEREGITFQVSPRVATNLLKCLFFVGLYLPDLGEDVCNECMEILTDLVAGYITEGAT